MNNHGGMGPQRGGNDPVLGGHMHQLSSHSPTMGSPESKPVIQASMLAAYQGRIAVFFFFSWANFFKMLFSFHFNKQVDHQAADLVSQDRDRSSCGSFYSNCWRTNRARALFRGRAMAGSLNCPIRMKWLAVGASARTSPKWTTRNCHVVSATIMTKISSTKRQENDTFTVLFAIFKIF